MTESEVIYKASSPSILCHERNNLTNFSPFRTLFQNIKISLVPKNPPAFLPYPPPRRAAQGALGAPRSSRKQAKSEEMTGPVLAASASPSGARARSDDGAERDLSLRASGAPSGGKGSPRSPRRLSLCKNLLDYIDSHCGDFAPAPYAFCTR